MKKTSFIAWLNSRSIHRSLNLFFVTLLTRLIRRLP